MCIVSDSKCMEMQLLHQRGGSWAYFIAVIKYSLSFGDLDHFRQLKIGREMSNRSKA